MKGETVTISAAHHRRTLEARRRAEALAQYADAERERMYRWTTENLNLYRQLTERCTYLYGLAASLGATPEQLAGERNPPSAGTLAPGGG